MQEPPSKNDAANTSERWAVYLVPPRAHPLWTAGCRWLGRDPETDETFAPPRHMDPASWQEIVARPAYYGFHATLKPPFTLAPNTTPRRLRETLREFAATQPPVTLPPLRITELGDFLALRPITEATSAATLAANAVRTLDHLRAPLTTSAYQRQQPDRLSPRQQQFLIRWGYPYVFDEFRLHFTLTGRLDQEQRSACDQATHKLLQPTRQDPIDPPELGLFHQPAQGHAFRLTVRYALAAKGFRKR